MPGTHALQPGPGRQEPPNRYMHQPYAERFVALPQRPFGIEVENRDLELVAIERLQRSNGIELRSADHELIDEPRNAYRLRPPHSRSATA